MMRRLASEILDGEFRTSPLALARDYDRQAEGIERGTSSTVVRDAGQPCAPPDNLAPQTSVGAILRGLSARSSIKAGSEPTCQSSAPTKLSGFSSFTVKPLPRVA